MGFEKYLNKRIKIFFDDGKGVFFKEGSFISHDNEFIFIKTNTEEAIPKARVVRIEVVSND